MWNTEKKKEIFLKTQAAIKVCWEPYLFDDHSSWYRSWCQSYILMSQFMTQPTHLHMSTIKQIICYLLGTQERGLFSQLFPICALLPTVMQIGLGVLLTLIVLWLVGLGVLLTLIILWLVGVSIWERCSHLMEMQAAKVSFKIFYRSRI